MNCRETTEQNDQQNEKLNKHPAEKNEQLAKHNKAPLLEKVEKYREEISYVLLNATTLARQCVFVLARVSYYFCLPQNEWGIVLSLH